MILQYKCIEIKVIRVKDLVSICELMDLQRILLGNGSIACPLARRWYLLDRPHIFFRSRVVCLTGIYTHCFGRLDLLCIHKPLLLGLLILEGCIHIRMTLKWCYTWFLVGMICIALILGPGICPLWRHILRNSWKLGYIHLRISIIGNRSIPRLDFLDQVLIEKQLRIRKMKQRPTWQQDIS